MSTVTKSVLHDATPSWNGYNYQGKVGLYVCLENILAEARKGVNVTSFELFLREHHIEYEWIEDFAIKKKDTYLSLHQVKHQGENNFQNHVEAIATILYRKNAVLSDTDIFKYFTFKSRKKGDAATIKESIKSELSTYKLIDNKGKLDTNWRAKIISVDNRYRTELDKCFSDFELLVQKAFSSSITYFHTADKVAIPPDDIINISGIPSNLVGGLINSKSLSCKNIHLSFDSQTAYNLALSDDDLNYKLDENIRHLLALFHREEQFVAEDIKLYKTALCSLIDQHLMKRHQHIRDKADKDTPYFMRTKPSIYFYDIFEELKKTYHEHNSQYWNLVCRDNLELAYKEKLDELDYLLSNSLIEYDLYCQYKSNVEFLKIDIIEQYLPNDCVNFLKKIYPHRTRSGLLEHQFYNVISEPKKIKTVFLNFIQKIMKPSFQKLTLSCSNNIYIYQPSCIDFNESDDLQRNIEIDKARKGLAENIGCQLSIQENVDFIVVNSTGADDVIPAGISKITDVDGYEVTSVKKESDKFTERKEVNFVDSRKALGDING